ncbi:MAG: adaptor protein MecA [Lachnospiraceae bacterium]|nr:adaptor protein MecA [Lachnospiraceae bacterium]
MKIEKINDNSIKCTLNKQDLNDRELHLSELAYGSEKAKALFSELLLQASYECGFDAQDTPLMIEAVPMSKDSLVLILTKVSDPEELNINYSNISLPSGNPSVEKKNLLIRGTRADDVIKELEAALTEFAMSDKGKEQKNNTIPDAIQDMANHFTKMLENRIIRSFTFDDLSSVIRLAEVLSPSFKGENTLYKNPQNGEYVLSLKLGSETGEEFNKVCNVCAEYGEATHTRRVSDNYFEEHYETIIRKKALQKLKLLSKH